jgi:hypothetical protein
MSALRDCYGKYGKLNCMGNNAGFVCIKAIATATALRTTFEVMSYIGGYYAINGLN